MASIAVSVPTNNLSGGIAVVGQEYRIFAGTTDGVDPVNLSITAGALPPGLTLVDTPYAFQGIEGTPSAAGTYHFTLHVSDAHGNTGDGNGTIVVSATQTAGMVLPPFRSYSGYGFTFDDDFALSLAGLTTPPFTYAAINGLLSFLTNTCNGTLSAGGDIASARVRSQPAPAGIAQGTVNGSFPKVTDHVGNVQATEFVYVVWLIFEPAITSGDPPAGEVGTPYGPFSFTGSGGLLPYTWTTPGGAFPNRLPAGITLDAATGALTGTPTEDGAFTPTVVLSDANGGQVRITVTIDISAGPPPSTEGDVHGTFTGFWGAGQFGGGTL